MADKTPLEQDLERRGKTSTTSVVLIVLGVWILLALLPHARAIVEAWGVVIGG